MNIARTRKLITDEALGLMRSQLDGLYSPEVSGAIFFVDGNKSDDSGDGTTWETAYKYLATGLAASHAQISASANRAWARRNRIYVVGDAIEEDLTKFAEKTDIIGVGTTNQHRRTRITGTHVLEATSADTYHGCGWHNIEFYGQDGGIIMDIPADQNGQTFNNCVFSAVAAATIGLRAVQSHDMEIIGCRFDPNTSGVGFSTAAIQINAGSITNFTLERCRINHAAVGLDFNPTDDQAINCWAIDNVMHTTGIGIDSENDEEDNGLLVVGNRMITDTDTSTVTNGYDFNLARAVANIITGTGGPDTDEVPYRLQA